MTDTAALHLAKALVKNHEGTQAFCFELDTEENAEILARHLRLLGCVVDIPHTGGRLYVTKTPLSSRSPFDVH